MIEIEEIMDESETCVRRKKVSEKLKKYIIETIMPQFEKQYYKCKNQTRGLYYMFCNTTKQPGVFSFAICIWTNHRFDSDSIFIENFFKFLVDYTKDLPAIKVARLQKKANGIRIRFDENYSTQKGLDSLLTLIEKAYTMCDLEVFSLGVPLTTMGNPSTPAKPEPTTSVWKPAPYVATEKKGNKMGDFSLSNLKDALVDKITHLDRKTVMILSIIALLLLIAGKYNTIKDILSGIKNKVKNSDNFKAMVTDGTNAINSLKKIVGVKGKGDADAKA